ESTTPTDGLDPITTPESRRPAFHASSEATSAALAGSTPGAVNSAGPRGAPPHPAATVAIASQRSGERTILPGVIERAPVGPVYRRSMPSVHAGEGQIARGASDPRA